MTSWRMWTARVPDPVLGARSAGARARLLVVAAGVLLAAADVFVQAPLVRGVFTGLHLAPDLAAAAQPDQSPAVAVARAQGPGLPRPAGGRRPRSPP